MRLIPLAIAAVAALAVAACGGGTTTDVDAADAGATDDADDARITSERWLASCASSLDCDGLTCICGVCTRDCFGIDVSCADEVEACISLDDAVGKCPFPSFVCAPTCDDDATCPNGSTCELGTCLPPPKANPEVREAVLRPIYAGAFAATRDGDTWRRQCGDGPVDGLLYGLGLRKWRVNSDVSTALTATDRVDGTPAIDVVSGGLDAMSVALTRFGDETYDPPRTAPVAALLAPEADPTGVDAILLVDQSGSIGGLVDGETYLEGVADDEIPSNFGQLASDRLQLRVAFAEDWVERMSVAGRVAVMGFGTGPPRLHVPCVGATGDAMVDLATCFGADPEVWLDTAAGVFSLQGMAFGFANLWEAVDTARRFLREASPDPTRAKHIVIISDGPDTCAGGETLQSCLAPCSTVDWAQVRGAFAAEDAADQPPIHVSVVQFEAPGYPGPDPRQLELACATGGQYHFIASNELPRDVAKPFGEHLGAALDGVANAARGLWQIAVATPTAPVGRTLAVEATLTLPSTFSTTSSLDASTLELVTTTHHTPASTPIVRVPCADDAACGVSGLGSCEIGCSSETRLCAPSGTTLPDTAACALGEAEGFCCDGACQPIGGACAACE